MIAVFGWSTSTIQAYIHRSFFFVRLRPKYEIIKSLVNDKNADRKLLIKELIEKIELYPRQKLSGQWIKTIHFVSAVASPRYGFDTIRAISLWLLEALGKGACRPVAAWAYTTFQLSYGILQSFDILFDVMDNADKKLLIKELIEKIELYPRQNLSGQWIKTIHFKFPMYYNDNNEASCAVCFDMNGNFLPKKNTDESVVTLIRNG